MTVSRHQAKVEAQLTSVASLGEPVRRQLYRFVAAQVGPVSREQAAAAVEVAHHIAKFHLDKLARDGLLEVEYRRPPGRSGPGAGRPTKLYRRADRDIAVSLPERRYDLAGLVLAEAITKSEESGGHLHDAVRTAARAAGDRLGEKAGRAAGKRPSQKTLTRAICEVLEDNGYEPSASRSCITLNNCPFHTLAARYTELVCGMNLDLISGLLDRLGPKALRPELDPAPGRCCVTIAKTTSEKAGRPF